MMSLTPRAGRLVYVTALAVVVGVVAGASGGSVYNVVSEQMRTSGRQPSLLTDPLRVAVSESPGFATVRPPDIAGFDIDVVNFLAAEAGVKPVYVGAAPSERVSMLQSTAVQLASGVVITEGRRQFIDFAGPYIVSPNSLLTRAQEQSISTIDDLSGKRICALDATTATREFEQLRAPVRTAASLAECVAHLREGEVDAVAGDLLALRAIMAEFPEADLQTSAFSFGESRYGIALPPGHAADCERLTDSLQQYIVSAEWEVSFQRHFGPQADLAEFRPDPTRLTPCPSA